MKRELVYNGKSLSRMTSDELRDQLQVNRKRSVIRAIFLLVITVVATVLYPILAIVPLGCFAVTQYWIMRNNVEIKKEIESRNR